MILDSGDTCAHGLRRLTALRACVFTATKTPARPTLTDAQLAEMMSLLRGSDTVELKLTVPAAQQRGALRSLGLDALAQIRQVVFFDPPDLALDRAGGVVRARRIQGGAGNSVIKLRPLDPDQVSSDVRRLGGFGVEVDAIPGGIRMPRTAEVRGGLRRDPPGGARRAPPCGCHFSLHEDRLQVAAEARVYLSEHGIDLSGEQQTKTRAALEFFAAELAAG